MILLDSLEDLKKGHYYLGYWNVEGHHIILFKIEDIIGHKLYSVVNFFSLDYGSSWSEYPRPTEVEWCLNYNYNLDLLLYKLTDLEILTHILVEDI